MYQSDITEMFKRAYNKTVTIENVVKSFEGTGIFPMNRQAQMKKNLLLWRKTAQLRKMGKKTENSEEIRRKIFVPTKREDMIVAGPSGVSKPKATEQLSLKISSDSESKTSVVSYTDKGSDNDKH